MAKVAPAPCDPVVNVKSPPAGELMQVVPHASDDLGSFHSAKRLSESHIAGLKKGKTSVIARARSSMRGWFVRVGWYESSTALGLRHFVRGTPFASLAMVGLFIALFLSDIFIMAQVSTNIYLDIILCLVLAVFAFEFIVLSFTDTSYLFGFFFWMDLVGTASMIFDVSFMLGTDAETPERIAGGSASQNIIVVRAARAAKLGARAGRLSRVLKIFKFIEHLRGTGEVEARKVKAAKVISSQLTNVLSTRVAFLTICIAVVLPSLGIFAYPETDESMISWTQFLQKNAALYCQASGTAKDAQRSQLTLELNRFSAFYESLSYGPYKVCCGVEYGDAFSCNPIKLDQQLPKFKEPRRKSSIREVSQNGFQTFFDLSTPKQLEAVSSSSLILFIIIVMCSFGLMISSSVGVIVLNPLERMLQVVREHCAKIFKYTDELKEDDDEDKEDDEEMEEGYDNDKEASEFVLLEMVVGKLTAIAEISKAKNELEDKEVLNDDDVMMLNWMQGQQVRGKRTSAKLSDDSKDGDQEEETNCIDHLDGDTLRTVPLEFLEAIETWNFNALELATADQVALATHMVMHHPGCAVWVRSHVQEAHLNKFVTAVESKYVNNPFHNFAHGVDVTYMIHRFFILIGATDFLPETSLFWMLIAAIAHDVGHIAVNNQYLIETSHELALRYNDRSPLENMHCATLFHVAGDPEANVFAQVEKDSYKEMRKGIIDAILHTDVTKHNDMIKEISLLYQMNSDAFDAMDLSADGCEVLHMHANRQLVLNSVLHYNDINNPMKPWELCKVVANLCLEEFFAQGDKEKAAGIPVQMLNDRDKVNRPNSQIGFIEFVITPMVEPMVSLFPPIYELAENLGTNITNWLEEWIEQSSPPAETAAKVRTRVQKVEKKCYDLANLRHAQMVPASQSAAR